MKMIKRRKWKEFLVYFVGEKKDVKTQLFLSFIFVWVYVHVHA